MRKRSVLVALLVLSFAAAALADEITFNFFLGAPNSITASQLGGLTLGSAVNFAVSDTTTGTSFPLDGTFTGSAGPAHTFNVFMNPNLITAFFSPAGANSVQILDTMNNPLVQGSMSDNGFLLTSYQDGTGAYLGSFKVSFVDPAVLALFGLQGQSINPIGSVSVTLAHDNFDGTTVTGVIGGGTVTIQTLIPEPGTLMLFGSGLLGVAALVRRKLTR